NQALWRMLRDNIRASDMVVGDMEAQVAACQIGAQRFVELVERFGVERVMAASEELMDYSERMLRREIEKLPDGSYSAEGFIDGFPDLADRAYRAPTIARFYAGNMIADTLMRALAPAAPDRVSAGVGNLKATASSGMVEGGYWVYIDISEGSYGGRPGKDGMDAVDTLFANTRNNPLEDIESHYPLRVSRYELVTDRGGPGRWRGGLGSVRDLTFTAPGGMSMEGDGNRFPPPGLFGGSQGQVGAVVFNPGDPDEAALA